MVPLKLEKIEVKTAPAPVKQEVHKEVAKKIDQKLEEKHQEKVLEAPKI